MIYDPHDDSFIAKNLREEEWRMYQRHPPILELAESIRNITNDGMVAKIKTDRLYELGLEVCFLAAISAVLIQPPYDCSHWAGIALCMLSHSRMEKFPEEQVIRFSKSPYDQEPMYWNNIEWKKVPGRNFEAPFREKVIIPPVSQAIQENLFEF